MTWIERYFSALKGARILDTRIGAGEIPVLIVHLAGEAIPREVGILCDAEGNGPGWIDNLPRPKVPTISSKPRS